MSDKHSGEKQQSEVKITSSFVWSVVGSIVIPVILFVLIATIVYSFYTTGSPKEKPEVIAQRIYFDICGKNLPRATGPYKAIESLFCRQ